MDSGASPARLDDGTAARDVSTNMRSMSWDRSIPNRSESIRLHTGVVIVKTFTRGPFGDAVNINVTVHARKPKTGTCPITDRLLRIGTANQATKQICREVPTSRHRWQLLRLPALNDQARKSVVLVLQANWLWAWDRNALTPARSGSYRTPHDPNAAGISRIGLVHRNSREATNHQDQKCEYKHQ
jgi:hypothetical protein